MRLKVSIGAAVSVALVAAGSGCGLNAAATPDPEEIVIAADLELSGVAAPIGTAYERALRLRVEQLNTAGGVDGRQIRLEVKDNRSDKTLCLANISEFAANPAVRGIITGVSSDCVPAAARTINDKQVPTISLSPAGDVTNPIADRRYVFKVATNPSDDAAALTSELSRANATRVGLLTTDDAYGRDGLRAMENDLDDAGGSRIVTRRSFKPTDTDVSEPVREVVAAAPDAIVVWAFADQAQQVAASAREAGYRGQLFFGAAAAGNLFLAGPTAAATNNTTLIFTQTMAIDDVIATTPAKAARKQWFRDYTSRYGNYYGPASFAADALQLLVDAIGRAGTGDPEAVRTLLETAQVDGLSGPIRITPANHSGLMPQALVALTANAGRWRLKI